MTKEELLKELLGQTNEASTLDFKREINLSSLEKKREFAKDVSAFANTNGGHIVFGKEDPGEGGKVVGIERRAFNHDQMQSINSSRCYPPVEFQSELVQLGSKWFGLLTIPESSLKPHEIVGTREVWIRRGATTDKATVREIMHMASEHSLAQKMPKLPAEVQKLTLEEKLIEIRNITGYSPNMTIAEEKQVHIFYETISQTTRELQQEIVDVLGSVWRFFTEKEVVVLTINRIQNPAGTIGQTDPEIITVASRKEDVKEFQKRILSKRELWRRLGFFRKLKIDQFQKFRRRFNWPLAI